MAQLPIAVIGNGWSAMFAAGFLALEGRQVEWIAGTGARLDSPLLSLEAGQAARIWHSFARRLGLDLGEPIAGVFLREFKNKAFREAGWVKKDEPEARKAARDEVLWAPETRFVPLFEERFELPIPEIENDLRARVMALPGIKRYEGLPVTTIDGTRKSDSVCKVTLGSGEEIVCEKVIYADRWSALPGISGLPKPLSFARNREPMGVLQASFDHGFSVAEGVTECFFGTCHKDSGEEIVRSVWGYFHGGGRKSTWTLIVAPEESEDNHEIAKKFRKLKQALERMFSGAEWFSREGVSKDFLSSINGEHVRFEEAFVFGSGDALTESQVLSNVSFVSDGFGPSSAATQVAWLLEKEFGLQVV